jgi:putative membrane protein
MLTDEDRKRIAAAIIGVESKSSGEIFCVLAHSVSRYREVPLAWATLAAFILPPLAVLSGLHRLLLSGIFTSWTGESASAVESLVVRALGAYGLVQAGLFLVVALIVSMPRVRAAMTPRFLKRHRVRQAARKHFAAAGAKLSHAQPHILIYASLADRQVELVAHDAIHKLVGEGPWNAAVAAVTDGMRNRKPGDGFVRAIEICGQALAAHFPGDASDHNQFSDEILEIR